MTECDLDAIFALYRGKGITDFVEPLYEREQELDYTRNYIRCMYGFYGFGFWLAFEKETNRLIARVGFELRELDGETFLELGYVVCTEKQRQGYGFELCSRLLAYAEEELQHERIICLTEVENKASVRLAEKLGFTLWRKIQLEGKEMEVYNCNFRKKKL